MKILKNRTVLGIVCIALSLLICFGVAPLLGRAVSEKTEIVRMLTDVKAGSEIAKEMVQTVQVGGYGLPENILRQTDFVVGKYAAADLFAGDYLLPAKLTDTPIAENAYLCRLDGTKQAMSITIKSFANGLSGKLQCGDIVSVIAPDYKKLGDTVIPPELKFVEVISVTADSGRDANTGDPQAAEEPELPATATMLVTPEQSAVLAALEADGKLHLSLVYRGSTENAAKFIAVQEEVLAALYSPEPEESGADGSPESGATE